MKKIISKVNNSYFVEVYPFNAWLFDHFQITLWFSKSWQWSIHPSSANNSEYFCLFMYLGFVNFDFTYIK